MNQEVILMLYDEAVASNSMEIYVQSDRPLKNHFPNASSRYQIYKEGVPPTPLYNKAKWDNQEVIPKSTEYAPSSYLSNPFRLR